MNNSRISILIWLTAITLIFGCRVSGHEFDNQSIELELDELVPKLLKEHSVPGVSIAVIRAGRVVWSKGYGLADRSKATPVKNDTCFNVGSVSKTLTAWAVMTLAEKGSIDLDAPVDRYLKRWHLPPSQFRNDKVSVRRLLTHTSGLSVYPIGASINAYLPGEKMPTLPDALSRSYGSFGSLRVVRQPGESFEYNNGNYVILQLLIEDTTRQSFADYIRRTIFKPLGMSDSSYVWSRELQASVATPYNKDGVAWPQYQGVEQGSGGLYTTASDLARFVAATAGASGKPAGRGILKSETVREMITPAAGTDGRYGFGYKMFPVSKERVLISHDGANEGWRAIFLIHPQQGDGLVLLANSDIGGKVGAPVICAVFARTTVDMSPLCSGIYR